MKAYQRFSNAGQMAAAVAVFAMLMLLMDSGGLVDWAERLDLGPERSVMVPVTTALHRAVGRFGFEHARGAALAGLGRIGWSDDPVAAEADGERSPSVPASKPSNAVVLPDTTMPRVDSGALAMQPKAAVRVETAAITAETSAQAAAGAPRRLRLGELPRFSHLPVLTPIAEGKPRTVVLAGDSMMAVGLSPTLLRAAPKYKDLTMIRAFKSGTGLARPEIFNWAKEYPAMLGAVKPDVVIVAIGANDGQGFVENGVTYPFGTSAWQAIYQARVAAYLAMLQADGATVVWLGLPPMKSDTYDDRIALVNRIDYEVVSAAPRTVWFSTAGLVGDAGGRYQDFGSVHGSTARLRQSDGIHLSDDGASLISEKLLPWLANNQ